MFKILNGEDSSCCRESSISSRLHGEAGTKGVLRRQNSLQVMELEWEELMRILNGTLKKSLKSLVLMQRSG